MRELTKEQIKILFEKNKDGVVYEKFGKFLYRIAKSKETILTMVSGKLETIKTAKEYKNGSFGTEYILINIQVGSSAEQYMIDSKTFADRYRTIQKEFFVNGHKWQEAIAKGQIHGFVYEGESIRFKAPWNEDMILETGDFLARPIGDDLDDIYRIEKDTFKQTYKEKWK